VRAHDPVGIAGGFSLVVIEQHLRGKQRRSGGRAGSGDRQINF
jgi:hypothetical protein